MDKRINGASETDTDKKEMMLVDRILSAKGRTLFTDHKQRRKDRSVHSENVDQVTRSIELLRIKTQLTKSILAMKHNPDIVHYMIDQVKAFTGSTDIDSGFFNLDLSDRRVAGRFGENVTEETIRDISLIERAVKAGNNLGWGTSWQNNFQRKNGVVNYGVKRVYQAFNAVKDGDENFPDPQEIRRQVEETGVLHPGNAFIDMLTMGIDFGEGAEWKDFILPYTETLRLFKATTLEGWINQSKSWDKLIASAEGRGARGEKMQIEDIRRIKKEIYDIIHSKTEDNASERKKLEKRLMNLKIGMTKANANRLVKWKLEWFPLGVLKPVLTMKGSEEQMRLEFAYIGLRMAFDMGLVERPPVGDWKYTDSQDAVNMARISVYLNLFGFTKVMVPKMFRGGIGGAGWQFRQYDYHQSIREMEWYRAAALSPEYAEKSKIRGWGALPFRITLQLMKKIIRGGLHSTRMFGVSKEQVEYWTKMVRYNKRNWSLEMKHDDKNLDRATNFFLMTAIPTMILRYAYHTQPAVFLFSTIKSISRSLTKDSVTRKAAGGMESVLLAKMMTSIALIDMLIAIATRGFDDDSDWEDVVREFPFSMEILAILLLIIDPLENAYKASRPYLPTPFQQLAPGAPGTKPVYEMIDDFTSF